MINVTGNASMVERLPFLKRTLRLRLNEDSIVLGRWLGPSSVTEMDIFESIRNTSVVGGWVFLCYVLATFSPIFGIGFVFYILGPRREPMCRFRIIHVSVEDINKPQRSEKNKMRVVPKKSTTMVVGGQVASRWRISARVYSVTSRVERLGRHLSKCNSK